MQAFANRILTGLVCGLCGCEFAQAHGVPVLCPACWRDDPDARHGHQRATHPEA
jgi:hypothetical protein